MGRGVVPADRHVDTSEGKSMREYKALGIWTAPGIQTALGIPTTTLIEATGHSDHRALKPSELRPNTRAN